MSRYIAVPIVHATDTHCGNAENECGFVDVDECGSVRCKIWGSLGEYSEVAHPKRHHACITSEVLARVGMKNA